MLNITPDHLTEAVPTALFVICALWAASSNRHWFVRTAIVGSALLVLLLVPAYDVVIEFGCVVLFLLVGLAVWRKRRQGAAREGTVSDSPAKRIPRLSMATLMLIVVVVAVVTSVAARVPDWPLHHWVALVGIGLTGGGVGLACVWIVCGRTRWWLRLLATPLWLIGFAVAIHVLGQLPLVLSDWTNGVYQSFDHYWERAWKSAAWGFGYWLRAVAVGVAILIPWLIVIRRTGWFDPFGEDPTVNMEPGKVDRATSVARMAAVALFILIALFPLAILYRLVLPPPIPNVTIPEPNGWDDLMAAGEMIGPDDQRKLLQWPRTNSRLPAELYRPEVVALIRRGLEREIVNPYMYIGWPESQTLKFSQLHSAVSAYAIEAERSKDLPRQLDAYWDLLRLTNEQRRVVGDPGRIDQGTFQWESTALAYYWPLRTRLSRQECSELLAKLVDYDKHRDTWEDNCARQRIFDANADWQTRVNLILANWSGRDPYYASYEAYNPVIRLRLLITDLAVRAYRMKHKKLPETVDALVPEFLPAVPKDPYGPIVYRQVKVDYVIYSVGPDGDDDSGRAVTNSSWDGDYTSDLMFQ